VTLLCATIWCPINNFLNSDFYWSIEAIASAVGYSSGSYFIKVFRNKYSLLKVSQQAEDHTNLDELLIKSTF